MAVSPVVSSWFSVGANVPQPDFLAWALSVEAEFAALNAWITATANVNTAKLADGAVTAAKLAANAVETAKILNGNVTNLKLADMAAGTFKGNNGGSIGAPVDMTAVQAARLLPYGAFERGRRAMPLVTNDFLLTNEASGFASSLISSGTIAAGPNADANHPGVVQLSSSATANSGVLFTTTQTILRLGGGEQFDAVFRTPAAFTNVTYRLGFHDTATSADAVDGAYFELVGSGVIVAKTSNNSTRTTSATVATLIASTWYHARVSLNANATLATFEIWDDSGTLAGSTSIGTNIPTAAGRETGAGFIATFGGVAATVLAQLDYLSFSIQQRSLVRGALT